MTGWWLTYSSEKWWTTRQLGWLFHSQLDGKSEYIHVPNHQPAMDNGRLSHWNISRLKGYFHNCLKMMCVCVKSIEWHTCLMFIKVSFQFQSIPWYFQAASLLSRMLLDCVWFPMMVRKWLVWVYMVLPFYVTYRQWSTKWLSWDDDSQYMEK